MVDKEEFFGKLKKLSQSLDPKNFKAVEKAAYEIAGEILVWQDKTGAEDWYKDVSPEIAKIRDLALDLELPKRLVPNYEQEIVQIKQLIDDL